MLQGVRERLFLLVGILLVVVAATAIVVNGAATDGPPFALADMHARITNLAVLPDTGLAQAALDRLAGKGRLNLAYAPGRPAVVVGTLEYDVAAPAGADGQLVLFVIDSRAGVPLRYVFGVGPPGSNVGQGWDGRYQRLSNKYRWLTMLAEQKTAAGYEQPGMAVSNPPRTKGPITRGGWAERVPVTSG